MKDQEYDYFYDDEQDAVYCYPGTNILKNKLNIRDIEVLHEAERDYSSVRQAELTNRGVTGDFSFKHLCSIHKHLFQDIIQNEPERLEALWEATNYALKRFREAGFEIGATESPIIPLYVRDTDKTFMVTKLAFDEGVFINPVIPPACAPQDTLVRVALMATHTKEQIDRAVEKLVKAFKALDIL